MLCNVQTYLAASIYNIYKYIYTGLPTSRFGIRRRLEVNKVLTQNSHNGQLCKVNNYDEHFVRFQPDWFGNMS